MKSSPRPQPFRRPDSDRESNEPWELAISGDLTEQQDELIQKLLDVPVRSRGTIFFDSSGGSAYTGVSLAMLIRLRSLDATGVVLGECSSAALLPFAACPRRFVAPQSTLYFHPVHWSSEEDVNLEEAAEWARHFKIMETDLDEMLARLFNLPLEKLILWTRPGRFMTGREVAAEGLAGLIDLWSGDLASQIAR